MPTETTKSLTLCELADPNMAGLESLSPFCLKVHRALMLAELPYARRHGTRPDEFDALNPTGQVPVLLVGDEAIADSTAILRRILVLAPRAFDEGLGARDLAERWLWEELADTALNGFLVAARWADDRNWPAVRREYFGAAPWFVRTLIAPRIRARVTKGLHARDIWRAGAVACWDRFQRLLDDLEARAPRTGYWLGDAPGVADVALFGQLASFRTPLTPWQAGEIAKRPVLDDWLDRVDQATRAGASRRVMVHQEARDSAPRRVVHAQA